MKKIYIILLLGFAVMGFSAPLTLVPEAHFLAIPGIDSLSNKWIMADTTRLNPPLQHPVDIDVLKLSSEDYRIIILDANRELFTDLVMDQQNYSDSGNVVRSGAAPYACGTAAAMCRMQHNYFFYPETDRIAVVFKIGAVVGIYKYDAATRGFTLKKTISNPEITQPAGIFWAFDNFFIVDADHQTIFRTDTSGNILSRWGTKTGFPYEDGYFSMSDISGYVDAMNTAHLYVSDGGYNHVDHLIATSSDPAIYPVSRDMAIDADTVAASLHENAYIPYAGIVCLNRFDQKLIMWNRTDSLDLAERTVADVGALPSLTTVHIREVCGRLILFNFEEENLFVLRSYLVPGAVLDNPLPRPSGHWTKDISPVAVSDSLHILNGTELIIDEGVHVMFDQSAAIVVDPGAKLTVAGTAGDSVYFDSKGESETWNGIYVNGSSVNGSKLALDYATFHHTAMHAINSNGPTNTATRTPVTIDHCSFDGTQTEHGGSVLMLWNNPGQSNKVSNTTIEHVPNGEGMYLYNCTVDFDSVTVKDCAVINSYIKKVSGTFYGCLFSGRTTSYSVLFSTATCSPDFKCCTFSNLAPATGGYNSTLFFENGTAPSFGGKGYNFGVSNVITDTSAWMMTMDGTPVLPIIDNNSINPAPGGRNDWIQNNSNGKYIQWKKAGTNYLCTEQYWNPTAIASLFSPQGHFLYGNAAVNPYTLCGGEESGQQRKHQGSSESARGRGQSLDEDNGDDLLGQAMTLENSESYAEAQGIFRTVATTSPDSRLHWLAATHVVTTDVHFASHNNWVPSLIDSLTHAESSIYDSRTYGKRLMANYYLNMREYGRAVAICDTLLHSGLTFSDSIYVATELLGIQMAAGLIPSGGDLDGEAQSRIPMGLRVTSLTQGLKLEQDLLMLLGNGEGNRTAESVIPTKYELYQNYPNPFNPNTEIKFDLPENIRVELSIYNTLGQKVTTLVDEVRPAGAYTEIWDSKNAAGMSVASGVYVYRIKAGNFVQSRKMALVR